jgi:hypothetical protein
MDVADLFVPSTITNKPVLDSWIYHCEFKDNMIECVLAGVLIVVPSYPHRLFPRGKIQPIWVGPAHISCNYSPSLSFAIFDKWNINNPCSTSCVRPGHFMVFLIVFSVLVCPG